MTTSDEKMLFEKAIEGDKIAFGSLQEHLHRALRRFLHRLIGNHSAEEDIIRDAFLALYLNLEKLKSADALKPYLYRVLRNLCYSELRRQGRFEVVSLDSGYDGETYSELPDQHQSTADQVEWTLLYNEVRQIMQRLPELQRQTLILYFEEELSYAQIAEAMTTDIGTVKSRLFYARKNLTKYLKPDIAEALGITKEK